jgi:hypothetical protein
MRSVEDPAAARFANESAHSDLQNRLNKSDSLMRLMLLTSLSAMIVLAIVLLKQ